ncbi:hypothetical protein ACTFIR_003790 [Dictyostelium discoideum]
MIIKSCALCKLNINCKDKGIPQGLEIPFKALERYINRFLIATKTMYAQNGFTVEVDQDCVSTPYRSKIPFGYMGEMAKTMDFKLKMTEALRAHYDGQTERMNREIIRILTKASTEYEEDWSDIIPLMEFVSC